MNYTKQELRADEQRIENINRVLDFAYGFAEEKGMDIRNMDRKKLSEEMYGFCIDAELPDEIHRQAFQHLISELNGTPSSFLDPITANRSHPGLMTVNEDSEPLIPVMPEKADPPQKHKQPDRPTKPDQGPLLPRFE